MKTFVVVFLLVALCAPIAARANESLGCDVWLLTGDIVRWMACRVGEWIVRAVAVEDQWMTDRVDPDPPQGP